jgi:hypothetical protein
MLLLSDLFARLTASRGAQITPTLLGIRLVKSPSRQLAHCIAAGWIRARKGVYHFQSSETPNRCYFRVRRHATEIGVEALGALITSVQPEGNRCIYLCLRPL